MAAAVTNVYLHPVVSRHRNGQDEHRPFRLTQARIQDIRDVARGVEESDVGVCCSYLVDTMGGEGADYDEHALNLVERFVDSALDFGTETDPYGTLMKHPVIRAWRGRLQRTRRTFAALRHAGDHRSADILFVAHGYPDPLARSLIDELGEKLQDCPISALARYTDVVEEYRLLLARAEAKRSSFKPGDRYLANGTLHALAVADGREPEKLAQLVNFSAYLESHARADRCISSGDALRHALAVFAEPAPVQAPEEGRLAFEARRAARKERKEQHDNKRSSFLTQVRIQATKMLSRAEKAYHDAWLSCVV